MKAHLPWWRFGTRFTRWWSKNCGRNWAVVISIAGGLYVILQVIGQCSAVFSWCR